MDKNKFSYDIADELFTKSDIDQYAKRNTLEKENLTINEITIFTKDNPYMKNKGTYCSFVFDHIEEDEVYKKLKKYLKKYLLEFITSLCKKNKPSILFVGLGNENYVPDSLGPRVVKNINSNYFYKKQIGCLIPQVMAITGMETCDIIKGVLKYHHYDLVIVIDSLATSSIKRLNKTIQITDSGIQPGSGIKNYRKEITKEELSTPVLVIGIATVISYQKIIEEFVSENQIDIKLKFSNDLVLTTKEIEHEIDYLTLLISEVLNQVI